MLIFPMAKSLQTGWDIQRLHGSTAPAFLDVPALPRPSQPLCFAPLLQEHCGGHSLGLYEKGLFVQPVHEKIQSTSEESYFSGAVPKGERIWRRNKNNAFVHTPTKKKITPWIMFLVSHTFLQTGKGGMLWRHISERLRKEADEANRAQVFTTPGSVTAWHYQNSSVPSAGRLPLPLQLCSGLGKKLHTAGGWVTSTLLKQFQDMFPLKLAFSLP